MSMDLMLQVWGGVSYLTNKILFALSEGKDEQIKRQLKIIGWAIYILGVPAWVIILIGKQNWIAASIEAGGIPAMLLGLYNTIHNNQRLLPRFNRVVSFCTYGSLVFGLSLSVWAHGGINSLSQLLEMGVMLGFLLGSYLMAKGNNNGWLFFMLMNLSMAALMLLQGKSILMAQQLLSLCFVIYGFTKSTQSARLQRANSG